MSDTYVPEEIRVKIGVVVENGPMAVEALAFQRWAVAAGDLNPLYFDAEYAASYGHPNVVMPPMYLAQMTNDIAFLEDLRPDGCLPLDANIPGLQRRLWGGNEHTFLADVHAGDTIRTERRLLAAEDKMGRSGPMVVLSWETQYINQNDVVVSKNVERLIAL